MKSKMILTLLFSLGCLVWASNVTRANPNKHQTDKEGLKVMSYNVLQGGTKRGQPLTQTAKVIQASGADIVGLQEVGDNAKELATLLGWNYVRHGWSSILTRFEIVEKLNSGVKLKLDSGREVYVFNLHLKPAPYQPYQLMNIPYGKAAFIKTEQEAITHAKKARGKQITQLFSKIEKLTNKNLPVFITGDFNEPSHLDWTVAAAKAGRHPIKVEYPSSKALAEKGFLDSWRDFRPDEMKYPGHTWSPLTKADNPKDHHDRIDFVYFKGKNLKVKSVKIVGENKQNADIIVFPYPSDHRAVVATFTLSK